MQQFQRGTNTTLEKAHINAADHMQAAVFDLDRMLPLELIREHTKTDDVPSVSDVMLLLYRKAAFEAAQEYTGLLLFGQQIITENVTPPHFNPYNAHPGMWFNYRAAYAFAQNFVWYYGLRGRSPERVGVEVGSNVARLPRQFDNMGLDCCNPCSDGAATARIQYVAGYDCVESIPVAVVLGVLKYIAHVIENPGDIVAASTIGGGKVSSGLGVGETANPAWASGAIEIWRSVKRDAI